MNPIKEKKVENEVKIEENEQEKEKERVPLNPFDSLSLFSNYIFGISDLHTELKFFPTIKIMGTMDLRDSTLEDQGSSKIKKMNFTFFSFLFIKIFSDFF